MATGSKDIHQLVDLVISQQAQLDRVEQMVRKLLRPAVSLSVQEKADAVRKAMNTGDKRILKQTMCEINGE